MDRKARPQVTDWCVCVSAQYQIASLLLKALLVLLHPITFVNLVCKTRRKDWSGSTPTFTQISPLREEQYYSVFPSDAEWKL